MDIKYPSIYYFADSFSAKAQRLFLRSIKAEYSFLVLAAILSMNFYSTSLYHTAHALTFFLAVTFFLWRAKRKPEQDWYRGRALAESVKTSTWRYCMKTAPFDQSEEVSEKNFLLYLEDISSASTQVGHRFSGDTATGKIVTEEMSKIRQMPLEFRKNYYLENRVSQQKRWYEDKSKQNASSSRFWVVVCCLVYASSAIFFFSQIVYPDGKFPISPLIVAASSIIGWMQVKKFNELSSAYKLTAFEIGQIQSISLEKMTEDDFSEYVEDTERAFSREHTQWGARHGNV